LFHGRHAATAEHIDHGQRIDAEKVAGHQCNGDGAQAHAAAAQAQATATAAVTTTVLEIVAFALVVHAHGAFP
jgi:hypothetical protein